MNSEAMAEFRRAGSARTLTQRPEHAECVRGAAYGLGVDRLQVVTPVRLLYRLGREVGSCRPSGARNARSGDRIIRGSLIMGLMARDSCHSSKG
jgi:hypothetical protein